jgi:DNA-binding transcriptional LysR family regulator
MDFDQLSAFLAIAQHGTVTAAAIRLHRSQSAISRRLALLEAEIGAPLFDRRGPMLALTDVGRAFLPRAESALAAVASAQSAVLAQLEPGAGTVSVAIVGTLLGTRLAQEIGQQLQREVRLSVVTATSDEVSRLLRRGDVNLGVRYFREEDADEESERIGVEAMCVVGPPAIGRTPLRLGRQRWIGFPVTHGPKEDFGTLLRRRLASAGLASAEVMTIDSLSAQKRLVEAGVGLALLPESSVSDELRRGTLCIVDMPRVATRIPVYLIARKGAYLSPAARQLATILRRVLRT